MERLIIELLRMFIRLREGDFAPHTVAGNDGAHCGWRRGEEDDREWLIRPPVFRGIFEPHDLDPIDAARVLRDAGALHGQDSGDSLQGVVQVGRPSRSARAYVVGAAALAAWKPDTGRDYKGYRGAGTEQYGRDFEPKTALIQSQEAGSDTLDALPERGARLALERGIQTLAQSPSPEDRNFGQLLRSQAAFDNSFLSAQVRVDEAKLKAKERGDIRERIMRIVAEERERIKAIEAQAVAKPTVADVATPGDHHY